MTPVIRRLQTTLLAPALEIDAPDPLTWRIKPLESLDPKFFGEIVSSHMVLNLEYSLLGQQIRANLLAEHQVNEEQIVGQLVAALLLAQLLEHTYQSYLIVPREVVRLREQQCLYRDILKQIKGTSLPQHLAKDDLVRADSFSQKVRADTAHANLYRLLFVRGKRLFDLIAAMDSSAYWYRYLIGNLDKYTDPVLPYVGWIFFIPRLSVNLFLLIKHTVPGFWMSDEEKSLGWGVRLQGQLLRRWFELGNDLAWFTVGIVNCFILIGALAPIGAYFGVAFFGYDIILSVGRAYIELNRLYSLREQYQAMADQSPDNEELQQQLAVLESQIDFEWLRLGSHMLTTTGIFVAMCCLSPAFAANPVLPLMGAALLVSICVINFALVEIINAYRPKDIIEVPAGGLSKLGFFARKTGTNTELPLLKDENADSIPLLDNCRSL